jgi:hypothetical protein
MLVPEFKSVYLPKGFFQSRVTEAIAQTVITEQSFLHVPMPPFAHATTTSVNKGYL